MMYAVVHKVSHITPAIGTVHRRYFIKLSLLRLHYAVAVYTAALRSQLHTVCSVMV